MHDTLPLLQATDFPPLRRGRLTTLQVNLGYRCNQSCLHCHVNAGPGRSEMMDDANVERVPQVLAARGLATLDLTGGAPELHPRFRWLVAAARRVGVKVIDRCNLTILSEPGQEDLADFLAAHGVEVVASLPCYQEDNVDSQRGKGVFERSIAGLRRLNALGYGQPGSGLNLHLVFNPTGPSLPPGQADLEAAYKRELESRYGIVFNRLYTLANMPILRFGSTLVSKGTFGNYMQLLKASHAANLGRSCGPGQRDWQGRLRGRQPDARAVLQGPSALADAVEAVGAPLRVADHCYGCTAGQGSSCGGALDEAGAAL
jgi:radical SAM/Cys-rich protein